MRVRLVIEPIRPVRCAGFDPALCHARLHFCDRGKAETPLLCTQSIKRFGELWPRCGQFHFDAGDVGPHLVEVAGCRVRAGHGHEAPLGGFAFAADTRTLQPETSQPELPLR